MTTFEHTPVLLEATLQLLDPRPGDLVLDGTVGLGGHAAALLERVLPGGRLVGLDVDASMLEIARQRLRAFGSAATLIQASYDSAGAVVADLGAGRVNVALVDLGMNSSQLDDPQRGFSFDRDGPLDMRFDQRASRRAMDLVNTLSETELADLFYELGQEGASRKIARQICSVRHRARITTTRVLAEAVAAALGGSSADAGRTHPATRVFQALRMAVNDEIGHLQRFLDGVHEWIAPGGRVGVISFHSGEDALVKRSMRTWKQLGWVDRSPRPVVAEPLERRRNPRSRSAKLRVSQRVEEME